MPAQPTLTFTPEPLEVRVGGILIGTIELLPKRNYGKIPQLKKRGQEPICGAK